MTRLTDDQIIALRDRMTDNGAPISPRMAYAGRSALQEIGYEDVSFTDPQKVFAAMIGVSGYSFDVLASLATEALESRAEIERLRSIVALGVEMRAAQARYFRDRSRDNLIASKQAEAAFDKAARDHLAGAGKMGGA